MRKLTVTLATAMAVLFVGTLVWNAEAATSQGAAKILNTAGSMSLVKHAACRRMGIRGAAQATLGSAAGADAGAVLVGRFEIRGHLSWRPRLSTRV
jgi:hypothetical protein